MGGGRGQERGRGNKNSRWLIGSESYSGRCWHARIRSTRSTARPSTTPSSQVTNSFPSSCHYPEGQTDKSQIGKRPQIESTWDEQYATGMIAMWAPKVADRPSVREARLKLEAITIPSMDRMTSFSFSEGSSGYATYKREQDEKKELKSILTTHAERCLERKPPLETLHLCSRMFRALLRYAIFLLFHSLLFFLHQNFMFRFGSTLL